MTFEIEEIKKCVRNGQYVYSLHAEIKRKGEKLTIAQIKDALLSSEMLEQYPDTGRGKSCLVLGFADEIPIHVVCGWLGEKIALVTVYIPRPPKFVDPWTRGGASDG
jgi:hypothetical protein